MDPVCYYLTTPRIAEGNEEEEDFGTSAQEEVRKLYALLVLLSNHHTSTATLYPPYVGVLY